MKNLLLILTIILSSLGLFAQYDFVTNNGSTIEMSTGDIIQAGSVVNGNTYIVTACAPSGYADHHLVLEFDNGLDGVPTPSTLCVHDGTDINAPLVACYDATNQSSPMAIMSTCSSVSGCLTMVLEVKNDNINFSGKAKYVFCCQDVHIDLTTVPAMQTEDTAQYVDICQGDGIQFNLTPTFPDLAYLQSKGWGYNQDVSSCTYEWDMKDGTTYTTQNVNHTYPTPPAKGYSPSIVVKDNKGCLNTNVIQPRVRMSLSPKFTDVKANPLSLCQGDPTNLTGDTASSSYINGIPEPSCDEVDLPDGTGVVYTSTTTYNIFQPGATFTDENDLVGVFAQLRHTFAGDLKIKVECPNGTSVLLHSDHGDIGGTNLGESETECATYQWSSTGTKTWNEMGEIFVLPAGNYKPENSLSGLNGCPLNGTWTLSIEDTWANDAGYLCCWWLEFDPDLYETIWSYTTKYTAKSWSASASNGQILSGATNSITATGTYDNLGISTSETRPFTFTVEDQNGCSYDTTINVTWFADGNTQCCEDPTPNAGNDTSICSNHFDLKIDNGHDDNGFSIPGNSGLWTASPSAGVVFTDPTSPFTLVQISNYVSHTFTWTEHNGDCSASDAITVTFKETPNAYAGSQDIVCGLDGNLSATISSPGNTFHWFTNNSGVTFGSENSQNTTVHVNNYGFYDFYVVENNGTCKDTSRVKYNFLQTPPADAGSDITICATTVQLNADISNWQPNFTGHWITSGTGNGSYFDSTNYQPDPKVTYIWPTGQTSDQVVTYTWRVENGICGTNSDMTVTFQYSGLTNNPGNSDFTCVDVPNGDLCYTLNADDSQPGYWTIPVNLQTAFSLSSVSNPSAPDNDPHANLCVDPSIADWGTSDSITVPMHWTVTSGGCELSKLVNITFYLTPVAYAGEDKGICGLDYELVAKKSISNSKGIWKVISSPTGGNITFGDGSESEKEKDIVDINASSYGVYKLVWTEKNKLSPDCASTDTLTLEFIRTPNVSAGADIPVCGPYVQLNAEKDPLATYGSWLPAPIHWVDTLNSPVEEPTSQLRPDAFVYDVGLTNTACTDTIEFIWQQYVQGTEFPTVQCVAKDTMNVFFVAHLVAENQTNVDPEVCGRFLELTSAQALTCQRSGGYWIDSLDNNVLNWWLDDEHTVPGNGINTIVEVSSYRQDAFAFVVYNGGTVDNPTCLDTSNYTTVTFKQKPQVDACPNCYLLEDVTLDNINGNSTPIHIGRARTDTVCFRDAGSFYTLYPELVGGIGEGSWSKSLNGINFANGTQESNGDVTLNQNDTVFVNIFNSLPGNTAGNAYILVWKAENSATGCSDSDTLLISFAKEPSGEIEYRRPFCYGQEALVWASLDADANPTTFNWSLDEDATIVDATADPTTPDSIYKVTWPKYKDCDKLKHGVRLVSSNTWGCVSTSSNYEYIEEPPLVTPQYINIDATCGQANGMIKVSRDSIVACEDTLNYGIQPKWLNSTIYDFQKQINYGSNPTIDSLVHASPQDTSWLELTYQSITASSETCKDTIEVIVDNSGEIDAIIDDERMDRLNENVTTDSKGNLTGFAPLDITIYHNTPDAKQYKWVIRDEDANVIWNSKAPYPNYKFKKGTYQVDLVVQSKEGCIDTTIYKFIIVNSESIIKIPNIFTPNGDGSNDYFQVYAKSLKAFKGMIMNRWGKVLYEWTDWTKPEAGWDGKISGSEASPGVYYYVIRWKGMYDEEETEDKGAFELVRSK